MLQHAHRGIYEFLWSEHKYWVMAVSNKSFLGMTTSLGKVPRILTLLKRISKCAYEEKTENYRALLSAYMHIREFVSRERQEEIVKTILCDEDSAACMIYEEVLANSEKSLPGCRIFYDCRYAINKFWDSQGRPGLWICFGPFQLHVNTQRVLQRVLLASGVKFDELSNILKRLKNGISKSEFDALPEKVIDSLRKNNAVAEPGLKKAYLNPRIDISYFEYVEEPLKVPESICYSGFVLEALIDSAEYPPEMIGVMPEFEIFAAAVDSESLAFVEKPADFEVTSAYDELSKAFSERFGIDNGIESDA